jgi:hypothetical protein
MPIASAAITAASGKTNVHLVIVVDIAERGASSAELGKGAPLPFSGAAGRFRPRAHASNSARHAYTDPSL